MSEEQCNTVSSVRTCLTRLQSVGLAVRNPERPSLWFADVLFFHLSSAWMIGCCRVRRHLLRGLDASFCFDYRTLSGFSVDAFFLIWVLQRNIVRYYRYPPGFKWRLISSPADAYVVSSLCVSSDYILLRAETSCLSSLPISFKPSELRWI